MTISVALIGVFFIILGVFKTETDLKREVPSWPLSLAKEMKRHMFWAILWIAYFVGLSAWCIVSPGKNVEGNWLLQAALIFMYFSIFVCNGVPSIARAIQLRIEISKQ